MTRRDIIRKAVERTSLTREELRKAVPAFFDAIVGALSRDEEVTLHGFGRFFIKRYPVNATVGTSRHMGAPRQHTRIRFTPSVQLNAEINGATVKEIVV